MGFSGLKVAASAGLVITRPSGVRSGGGDTKFSKLFVMVGSPIEVWHEKTLGWIHMCFFLFFASTIHRTTVGFSSPRSRSIVCGRVLEKVVSLLGYKQQDLGIAQSGRRIR